MVDLQNETYVPQSFWNRLFQVLSTAGNISMCLLGRAGLRNARYTHHSVGNDRHTGMVSFNKSFPEIYPAIEDSHLVKLSNFEGKGGGNTYVEQNINVRQALR
jgi:hypothetical protein